MKTNEIIKLRDYCLDAKAGELVYQLQHLPVDQIIYLTTEVLKTRHMPPLKDYRELT